MSIKLYLGGTKIEEKKSKLILPNKIPYEIKKRGKGKEKGEKETSKERKKENDAVFLAIWALTRKHFFTSKLNIFFKHEI